MATLNAEIPQLFSVPLLKPNSCPPPNTNGFKLILSFTYKEPTPLGPVFYGHSLCTCLHPNHLY